MTRTYYDENLVKKAKIEAKIEMARKMLAKNKPVEEIIEFADLDIDTINDLQENIEQESE